MSITCQKSESLLNYSFQRFCQYSIQIKESEYWSKDLWLWNYCYRYGSCKQRDDDSTDNHLQKYSRDHMLGKGSPNLEFHYLISLAATVFILRWPTARLSKAPNFGTTFHLLPFLQAKTHICADVHLQLLMLILSGIILSVGSSLKIKARKEK